MNFAALAYHTLLQILVVVLVPVHGGGRYIPVGAAVFAARSHVRLGPQLTVQMQNTTEQNKTDQNRTTKTNTMQNRTGGKGQATSNPPMQPCVQGCARTAATSSCKIPAQSCIVQPHERWHIHSAAANAVVYVDMARYLTEHAV